MKTKLLLAFILVFLLRCNSIFSNVINALSCSQVDVQAAINIALDGDTIKVPAGTATWTKTVVVDMTIGNRALIIRGAGIGQTTIYDGVARVSNTVWHVLKITTAPTKPFRLTGFTFKTSNTVSIVNYDGLINITGSSKAFRIDHNEFLQGDPSGRAIQTNGWLYGVIDHNTFISPNQAITIFHTSWGNKSWGDGSWADSLTLGSDRAIFIEDNYMRNTTTHGMIDAWCGARYVVRNNKIVDSHVDCHGTETSLRYRSIFSWEVYDNNFTLLNHTYEGTGINIRGGTGVACNNTFTFTNTNSIGFYACVVMNNYRNHDSYNPFGSSDGSSPWDKNYVNGFGNPIVYESATHTAGTSTTGVLTDNSKNWTVNQWVGYSLRNVSKNWGSEIVSNTLNTITTKSSLFGIVRTWTPTDVYQILKVEAGLDQVGRSTGDLILGGQYTPPPYPAKWPNQKLEPAYIWGNTKNNVSFNSTSSTANTVKLNRDYYVGVARPGYIPYTYPHPLTLCGYTSDSIKGPKLTAFAISSSVVCQGQSNVVYGVPANATATFTWNYTGTGVTISNGSSNIKSINFSPTATSGTLTLVAGSLCGISNILSLPITVNAMVANAGPVSGLTTVLPSQTNVTYSVAPIANATSYIWTLPFSATGTSNTNTIVINYGSNALSDKIMVKGNNGCGSGASSTLAITVTGAPLPSAASAISGSVSVCALKTYTYSTPTIANAVSYIWTLPAGTIGSSNTNTIAVTYSTGSASGNITVKGNNGSGSGAASTLAITVNPLPAAATTIIGASPSCLGQTKTYTVAPIANATSYIWTFSGFGNTGGSTTNTINIFYTSSISNVSSYITVEGLNVCGSGLSSNKTVILNPLPVISYLQNPDTLCNNTPTFTLSVASPTGGIYGGTGVTGNTFNASTAGPGVWNVVYSYTNSNSCTNTATQKIMVNACTSTGQFALVNNELNATVFPNPSSGKFTLLLPQNNCGVKIMNVMGQVLQGITLEGKNELDFEINENGIYFVQIVTDDNKTFTKRVVVTK